MNTWDPNHYAKNSRGQEIWAKELIEKIDLQGNESILDIGCGDGKITDLLAQMTSGETVGIDFSDNMIAFAKEQFGKPVFMQMDAQALAFENRFDVVFSNAALHWVSDHKSVLSGIYKALKPDGKAVLQMGGKGNAQAVFNVLENLTEDYRPYFKDFVPPYTFCSDAQYKQWLNEIGFSSFEAKLILKKMLHEDADAFRGWLETTWFPYLMRLPEKIREVFLQTWIKAYIDINPSDKEGRISIDMVRLEVIARK